MPTSKSPKIITANALINGDVIYFTAQGTWSPRFEDAEVFYDEAIAQDVLIRANAQVDQTVGVYLTDVIDENGSIKPAHFREDFRKSGPSNYFHGKQESVKHV